MLSSRDATYIQRTQELEAEIAALKEARDRMGLELVTAQESNAVRPRPTARESALGKVGGTPFRSSRVRSSTQNCKNC